MSYSKAIEEKHSIHSATQAEIPVIDMHLHMVNFNQKSDGLKELLKNMDEANVSKSVVFGLPVKKKWESFEPKAPHYYLDDNAPCYYYGLTDEILAEYYLNLDEKEQKRLAPMICGFNPTDCSAIDHLEYIYNKYPFWKGVGELLLRHDDLTNLIKEETARFNHLALKPIFAFCIKKDLPLMIHQNVTSVGIHDDFEYLHEVKEVFQEFPDLKLIWAHCGISRRVSHKTYHHLVRELLSEFPNLHVDIAWVVYDDIVCEQKGSSLLPKKEWVSLIEENSNRFMLGSDLCGHFDNLGTTIGRYNSLFDLLSKETAQKLAYENANAIWFKED